MIWSGLVNSVGYLSAGVFAIGILHAVYKAIDQTRKGRKLEARQLRWQQSREARSILDAMEADEYVVAAMLLLDWDGRRVTVNGKTITATYDKVDAALRTVGDKFNDDEVLIRDCYDHLFYYLERIGLWIDVELISIYDVVFPIGYLADCIAHKNVRKRDRRAVFKKYLDAYDYERAGKLLGYFKTWDGEFTQASRVPELPAPRFLEQVRQFIFNFDPPNTLELANK